MDTMQVNQLVEDNMGLVYGVLNDKCKPWDEDDFQEGCVGLINAAKMFNPALGNQFSSYAYIAILNRIINTRHKNRTYNKYFVASIDTQIYDNSDVTFADLMLNEEFETQLFSSLAVKEVFDKLNKNVQRLVYYKYFVGLTHKEISKIMGTTRSAQVQSINMGFKKIRKLGVLNGN